jgi:hypothetical protein
MAQVLVAGGILQCSHQGQVKLSGGDARLNVSGQGAITFGMEVGISFAPGSPGMVSPCPFTDPKSGSPSPCTATMAAISGSSTLLTVGGTPVLLDSANGIATNTADPSATWKVSNAGQTLMSSS